jgi:hypothetical protein
MQLALKPSKCAFWIASIIPLIACTNEISKDDVEHGLVASRPISEKAEKSMLEQALESHTEIRENIQQSYHNKNESQVNESIKECCCATKSFIPQHFIKGINHEQYVIITEDGAQWRIRGLCHPFLFYYWLINDPITIQPSTKYFDYPYQLKNERTGGRLSVELIVGPELYSPYAICITEYNMDAKKVCLSNNSSWMIADADMAIFQDWQTNDQIIIGSSNSWFSSYDAILINPQMNNFVRAKTY